MAQHGAAIHLPQAQLTPEHLAECCKAWMPRFAGDGREGACIAARARRTRVADEIELW